MAFAVVLQEWSIRGIRLVKSLRFVSNVSDDTGSIRRIVPQTCGRCIKIEIELPGGFQCGFAPRKAFVKRERGEYYIYNIDAVRRLPCAR